jgi:hypothetical protein
MSESWNIGYGRMARCLPGLKDIFTSADSTVDTFHMWGGLILPLDVIGAPG